MMSSSPRYPHRPRCPRPLPWLLLIGLVVQAVFSRGAQAAAEPFPVYPCIADNVAFWTRVYTEHPASMGFLHDMEQLGIVYEEITLVAGDDPSPAARQANDEQLAARKESYRQLLLALAEGQRTETAEGRRVLALFGPGARAEQLRAAAERVRFQRCLRDRFQAGLKRSGRYLAQIRETFSRHGLPADLAYLPHVESSFNYEAYSKSGAAGIWQFIPDTGRQYLTIVPGLDERRDPIVATQAAARFLQGNYQKLGSWPLALTAYNHGVNGMLRAKEQLGDFESIFHRYDNPRFGFASRNFYAEFLAAREVARNYQRYFPGLRLEAPMQTASHTLAADTGLPVLVKRFGVDRATLAALNPALQEPVLSGKRPVPTGYQLRLPKKRAAGKGQKSRQAANPKPTAS